jgi:hypothetical protein
VPRARATPPRGHASIQTTLNIYTPFVDASHRQAIEAVERQLFPTVPKSGEPDAESEGAKCCEESWLDLEAPPGFEPGMEVLQPAPAAGPA